MLILPKLMLSKASDNTEGRTAAANKKGVLAPARVVSKIKLWLLPVPIQLLKREEKT